MHTVCLHRTGFSSNPFHPWEDLEVEDEYEFYRKDTLVCCIGEDNVWKAVYCLASDTRLQDIHPSMIILP